MELRTARDCFKLSDYTLLKKALLGQVRWQSPDGHKIFVESEDCMKLVEDGKDGKKDLKEAVLSLMAAHGLLPK
jgi:hypothetical protein